jgi:hypothetical protein
MPQLLIELFSEEIPARMQAQAARGGVGGDDAVGVREIAGLQAVRDAAGESGAQFHECLRRQFFGLQFDE